MWFQVDTSLVKLKLMTSKSVSADKIMHDSMANSKYA